jgi:hypothetical protein
MTEAWRKLHNEELHSLYPSPSIIRMTNLRKMRWAGQAARMEKWRGMHIGHWCERQKERDDYEDQDICGWIILRWILKRYDEMGRTGLIWLRIGTGGRLI